jgi:5-methylcytosine-specific restriction endonuclease McrA
MSGVDTQDRGAIGLAERILTILGEGRFTATYKYAVLLGLMDLCLEDPPVGGNLSVVLTTLQLARKVVEMYWPHSSPYRGKEVLKQNSSRTGSQAEILRRIQLFRARHAPDPSAPLAKARVMAPETFEALVRFVEWKLIEMPLPRLQVLSGKPDPFLYTIGWTQVIRRQDVARYQHGEANAFDNRILLGPHVGQYLVQLNGLLRPLIHRQWAGMVASLNRLEEARLEDFLFGVDRIPLEPVRPGLQELQGYRCFYCESPLRKSPGWEAVVDHFIPWARYPDNGVENLVVAHSRCNGAKRDFLAALPHVARWRSRILSQSQQLVEIASRAKWDRDPAKTEGVARTLYFSLPEGAQLWAGKDTFVALDRSNLPTVFS